MERENPYIVGDFIGGDFSSVSQTKLSKEETIFLNKVFKNYGANMPQKPVAQPVSIKDVNTNDDMHIEFAKLPRADQPSTVIVNSF